MVRLDTFSDRFSFADNSEIAAGCLNVFSKVKSDFSFWFISDNYRIYIGQTASYRTYIGHTGFIVPISAKRFAAGRGSSLLPSISPWETFKRDFAVCKPAPAKK
jgi:hypothetical protein